jgi:hypothetical protein
MAKQIKKVSFQDESDKIVLGYCNQAKLSVSGVKYGAGHDGSSMECNLKIGNRIVGILWDDSWGGGYNIQDKSATVKVNDFNNSINDIMTKAPKTSFDLFPEGMTYSYDMVVGTMIEDFNLRKDCKKKTIIKATKIDKGKVHELNLNCAYDGTEALDNHIENILSKDGFIEFEIINKRFK